MPLSSRLIHTLTEPGRYRDADGLYLQVREHGRRSWLFRYMLHGRARSMGLGPYPDVSLVDARAGAAEARRLLREGRDPIAERAALAAAASAAFGRELTFADVAERYIAAQEAGWTSLRHRQIWRASIANDVLPVIGTLPIGMIDTDQVLRVLEPIWRRKPDTAVRVRGRIEAILSYAIARGWREGPNPALWRGHLRLMLPSKAKLQMVEHFAALDWREAPAFMVKLRGLDSISARALEFLILTAARSEEVRGAIWTEIDLERAVWTVPASRMKGSREHRVPLSGAALAVLEALTPLRAPSWLIFPGQSLRRAMGVNTLLRALHRVGCREFTVHGMRSTFRDWASEATSFSNHVVEQALAHSVGNAVERAYRRGDLFTKRQALMDDWAAYLARPPAAVVPLRAAGR
jgi:integrase